MTRDWYGPARLDMTRADRTVQIEFPSILLPQDITSGSIVDVNVNRNHGAEAASQKSFNALQSEILSTFGSASPSAPVLRCRNATQTSVVLEWDPIQLATAELRSLSLYRNGSKAGAIPRPFEMTSTKISGLAVDTEYTFALVLRTSAGTYSSGRLAVRTHKMTDLRGITITPGPMPPATRDELEVAVRRMGAKLIESVRIDTTHFVCTDGRGPAWEKASEMNIPIVLPDWVKGCEREGRLVGVRGFYLNADPKLRPASIQVSNQTSAAPQQASTARNVAQAPQPTAGAEQSAGTPRMEITPPTPQSANKDFSEEDGHEGEDSRSALPSHVKTQDSETTATDRASTERIPDHKSENEEEHDAVEESATDHNLSNGAQVKVTEDSDNKADGEGFDEVAL
ncbi:hypothetical protein MRB53_039043 [Persea americana]|nr:hypothetical protein MRB53_039043 [Persea americana]